MGLIDDYMKAHMLKVLMPSMMDVVRENQERIRQTQRIEQTIIVVIPQRHYPVRSRYRRYAHYPPNDAQQ